MEVLKAVKGLRNDYAHEGAQYYVDEDGIDWYGQRNLMATGNTLIAVWPDTRKVQMLWQGEPDRFGLPLTGPNKDRLLDVYLLKDCPINQHEFMSREYKFDGTNLEDVTPVAPERAKQDILADLDRLREELLNMEK